MLICSQHRASRRNRQHSNWAHLNIAAFVCLQVVRLLVSNMYAVPEGSLLAMGVTDVTLWGMR